MERKRPGEEDALFTPLGKQPRVEDEDDEEEQEAVPQLPQGIGALIGSFMSRWERDAFINAAAGNALRPESASRAACSIGGDMSYHGIDVEWIDVAMRTGKTIPRIVNARTLAFHASSAVIQKYLQKYPSEVEDVIQKCRGFGRFDVLMDMERNTENMDMTWASMIDVPILVNMFGRISDDKRKALLINLMKHYCASALQAITSKFDIAPLVKEMTMCEMPCNRYLKSSDVISTMQWALTVGMTWGEMSCKSVWTQIDILQFQHDNGYAFTQRELIFAIQRQEAKTILLLLSFGVTMPEMSYIETTEPEIYRRNILLWPLMRRWILALGDGDMEKADTLRRDIAYNNPDMKWIQSSSRPQY